MRKTAYKSTEYVDKLFVKTTILLILLTERHNSKIMYILVYISTIYFQKNSRFLSVCYNIFIIKTLTFNILKNAR